MTTLTVHHHLVLSVKHLWSAVKISYSQIGHSIQEKQQEKHVSYLNDAEDILDLQTRIRKLDKKFEQRPAWLKEWLLHSMR